MSYIEKTKVSLSLLVMSGMMLTKPRASFAQTVPQHVTKSANDTLWWSPVQEVVMDFEEMQNLAMELLVSVGRAWASLVAAPQATE